MNFAILRNYIVLGVLTLFVAYFGVWELYKIFVRSLGDYWALALAIISALGLLVIIIVGVIIIRTKARIRIAENEISNCIDE